MADEEHGEEMRSLVLIEDAERPNAKARTSLSTENVDAETTRRWQPPWRAVSGALFIAASLLAITVGFFSARGNQNFDSSGTAAVINKVDLKAVLPKTCVDNRGAFGALSQISEPFPSSTWTGGYLLAFQAISACVTSKSFACSSPGVNNITTMYVKVSGTEVARLYQSRMNNILLMKKAFNTAKAKGAVSQDQFEAVLGQLQEEVGAIIAIDSWFDVIADFFDGFGKQMPIALDADMDILAMKTTSNVQQKKKPWWKIINFMLNKASSILEDMPPPFDAIGLVMEGMGNVSSKVKAVYSWRSNKKAAKAEAASEKANTDAVGGVELAYADAVANIMGLISNALSQVAIYQKLLVTDYGKLKRMLTIVMNCKLDGVLVQDGVAKLYGLQQWFGLGLLMPSKYVSYFQRDFGQSHDTPGCVYSSMCSDVSDGYDCFKASIGKQDSSDGWEEVHKSNTWTANQCASTTRYYWMGELTPNAANLPSADFWTALAAPHGPFQGYINPMFNKTVTTGQEAYNAFFGECQYLNKYYVPATKSGNVHLTIGDSSPASQVPQMCSVFHVPFQFYSYPDCNTKIAKGEWCVAGYGTNNGDGHGATGNFNQYTFVPSKSGKYNQKVTTCPENYPVCSTDKDCVINSCKGGACSWVEAPTAQTVPGNSYNYIDGYDALGATCTGDYTGLDVQGHLACCLPWRTPPAECQASICDCWNLEIGKDNGLVTQTQFNDKIGKCQSAFGGFFGKVGWAGEANTTWMSTTSTGESWVDVYESGDTYFS